MIALAWAASRPAEVRTLTVLDAVFPGVNLEEVIATSNGRMWHFDFFAAPFPYPEMLFDGHVEEFFTKALGALSNEGTFSPDDMAYYAHAYSGRERLRGGFEHYRALRQDAADFRGLLESSRLHMPLLAIGGRHMGESVAAALRPYAYRVISGTAPTGHFVPEEDPVWLVEELRKLL
jgi:pimeloyl-ACP methyl ester carboxylesterase